MTERRSTTGFAFRLSQFREVVNHPRIDLARAALHLCFLKYPEVDIDAYLRRLDTLADEARARLAPLTASGARAAALAEFLFLERGFTGNAENYYDLRNSCLTDVLDRRLGIPITLSVVFLEVAKRLGIDCAGVGMPGHFLVRHISEEEGLILLDPFNGGRRLKPSDCRDLLHQVYGRHVELHADFFRPVTNRQILLRMLANVKTILTGERNWPVLLNALEMVLVLRPDSIEDIRDRGLVHIQLENWSAAIDDLTLYCGRNPRAADVAEIHTHLATARRELAKWN